MKTIFVNMILLIAGLAITGGGVHAAEVDNGVYADLLRRHVSDGRVDYQGFKRDEALLDRYLATLAEVDPQALSADERFAFFVNAYNAWTIKLILSRYPGIGSIKELGSPFKSPWKIKIARIGGQLLTLDQIEHDTLRRAYKDPRVHFVVNCASKGCPPLQPEPLTGGRLDGQLNHAARAFINDPRFNRLEGDTLWVSRIFDWFATDFNNDVIGYMIRFAEKPLSEALARNRERLRVEYLEYDWSLNGR